MTRHPLLRLLRLAGPHRGRLALAVATSVLTVGCAVGLMATSAWLISRAAEHPPISVLTLAVVGVRAFGVGRGAFRYAERLLSHDAAFRALADLRVRVFEALVPLAPAGLPAFRSGDLLSRLVADVDAMQDAFLRCLLPPVVAVVVGAGAVALTWVLLPEAGALLLVGLVVAGAVVPALAVATGRRGARRTAEARAALTVRTVDLLHGTADLVAYGATARALDAATDADRRLARLEASTSTSTGLVAAAGSLAQGLTVLAVTLVALPAVADGRLRGVLLAVVVLTAMASFEAVLPLATSALQLATVRAAARRVFAVLDTRPAVTEPAVPAAVPAGPLTVVVDGARLRYGADGGWALDGVDLRLEPGQRVALVGPSGAGKSTLLAVLLRFHDLDAGTVTLGGVDLRDLAGDDVRRVVRGCTQDAHLFDSTLRENLRLARPDCTDEQLRAAAAQARLLEWVEAQPHGWDTPVGEGGVRLSGGQRQRLALARALLADPQVLVLDEPTEGLDPPTADAVTADLLAATEGRTTLVVTHRLAGLAAVDQVVVLDGGRVVQRGTHDELLATPGPYRRMWAAERVTDPAADAA